MSSFSNNLRQYEIAEARKRMGLSTGSTASEGFTNTVSSSGNAPSLNDSTAVGYQEMQNAKNQMSSFGYSSAGTSGMASGLSSNIAAGTNTNPSLYASNAVGTAEIQNAKQNMDQSTQMY